MKTKILLTFVIAFLCTVGTVCAKSSLQTIPNVYKQDDSIVSDFIKLDSEYKLVFFGYAGCYHFCDPRLRQIDSIYEKLKNSLDINVLFVDISVESTHAAAKKFVTEVNSAFEVVSPDEKGIKRLQKKFQDVYVQKMPDGEYLHSGFLYLLKRYKQKYYLLKIYPEFFNTKAVVTDIKKRSRE